MNAMANKQKSTQNLNVTSSIKITMAAYYPATVTSDVIVQFFVRLFFGLELVLVMIRVGAKFRL